MRLTLLLALLASTAVVVGTLPNFGSCRLCGGKLGGLFFFLLLVHLAEEVVLLPEGPHVVGQHVGQQTDLPDEAGEQNHEGHDPQHHVVHQLGLHFHLGILGGLLRVRSLAGFVALHHGAGVEVGGQRGDDHQGDRNQHDVATGDILTEGGQRVRRHRHGCGQGGAEEVCVQEGLHFCYAEAVVREVAVFLDRQA